MIRIFHTHIKNIYYYYCNYTELSIDSEFRVIYKEEKSRTGVIESEYPKIINTKEVGLSKYGLVEKSKGGYTLVDGIRRTPRDSESIIRNMIDSLLMCDNVIELNIKLVDGYITVNSSLTDTINLYSGFNYKICGDYVEILQYDVCIFNSNSNDLFKHSVGDFVCVVGTRIIPLHIFEWKDPLTDVVDVIRSKYDRIMTMKKIDVCKDDIILIPPKYGSILRDKKYEYKSTIELNFDHPSLIDQPIIIKSKHVKGFGRVSSCLTKINVQEEVPCEEAPWSMCSSPHDVKIKKNCRSISVWIRGNSIHVGPHIIDGERKWKCIIISDKDMYLNSMFIGCVDDFIEITSSDSVIMNIYNYDMALTKDNITLLSGNIGSSLFIYEYCVSIYTKGPTIYEECAQIDHYISSCSQLPYCGPFTTIVSIKNIC